MKRSRLLIALASTVVTVLVVGGVVLTRGRGSDAPDAAPGPPTARTSPSAVATPAGHQRAGTSRHAVVVAAVRGVTRRPPPLRHVYPVAHCSSGYGNTHHDYPAADVFADRDCLFVAPVTGRVDEVSRTDTWSSSVNDGGTRGGRSVSIVGEDGVRYYGAHLTRVLDGIRPGTRVVAGQTLGLVGDSGSARGTGTHLHFGISWPTPPGHWWIRRGAVAPQPFLDAWRAGSERSPVAAVAAARRTYGDDSRCHVYC